MIQQKLTKTKTKMILITLVIFSVLGPLLFVLYINDIYDSVSSKILKFAEDTKILNTVCSEKAVGNLRTDV